MKTELVSARLPKEDVKALDTIAKEEKTDKTTALKKIFDLGTKQYKLEKAVQAYQTGKAGLGKAAGMAGLSVWEMMDELKARNVPNPLSEEDSRQGLENLRKIWRKA